MSDDKIIIIVLDALIATEVRKEAEKWYSGPPEKREERLREAIEREAQATGRRKIVIA